ncbi:hypothetical protein GCM10027048_31610 [Hymenobacter coalescens]
MKKSIILLLAMLLLGAPLVAQQRYSTRSATIDFFSHAPLEDITARNSQVAASVDLASRQLAFVAAMQDFVFANGLMQTHFNTKYVESDKYPRATFSGRIQQLPAEGLPASGAVSVVVEGDLTIHGVKRRVQVPGTLEMLDRQLVAKARFEVAPADYHIGIPALVREHIAKTVTVAVYAVCAPGDALPVTSKTARP